MRFGNWPSSTRIILKSHIEDTRLIDYEKKMVDSLFSQLRYEQKFILTKDRALFVQFLAAKDDFERMLAEINSPRHLPYTRILSKRSRRTISGINPWSTPRRNI